MRKDMLTTGIATITIGIVLLAVINFGLLIRKEENSFPIPSENYQPIGNKYEKGDKIKLTFNSNNTLSDVFFCTENDYEKWGNGQEIKKYGTITNKTIGEINFVIPETGVWYIVFNNLGKETPVNVNYKIELVQYTPSLILFSSGIILFIVGCVFVPTSFLFKKKKKKKVENDFVLVEETDDFVEVPQEQQQHQYQQMPSQLVCKSCKRIIDNPEQYYYNCPYCGRSLR